MEKNAVEIKIRFVETDAMGVVHHSNVYSWFEIARYQMFENLCPNSVRELAFGDFYLPVISTKCTYHEFMKYGEILIINTWLVKTKSAKLIFEYEVRKKNKNKIIAKGRTEHVCLNSQYKMLLNLPECIKKDIINLQCDYPEYIR